MAEAGWLQFEPGAHAHIMAQHSSDEMQIILYRHLATTCRESSNEGLKMSSGSVLRMSVIWVRCVESLAVSVFDRSDEHLCGHWLLMFDTRRFKGTDAIEGVL